MPASLAPPASILFINVSRIGDTILATPALRALARAWPSARITFLGHPKRFEIVRHLPFVHEVGPIDKHRARFRGWLGRKRWDLAFVLGFDRPLVAFALRAARRVVAFRQQDEVLDDALFRCVERPAFQSLHSAKVPLLLLRALDIPPAGGRLAYVVTAEEQAWARANLQRRVPQGRRPLVGLQVASFPTKGYRDWPIEKFRELCERILGRWPQAHFLLFGGKLEVERTRSLSAALGSHATLFAGALTLRQSAALMNQVDLYVGVDTGPTHIMGALAASMVALYHCYSPGRLLAPLERPNCFVVEHPRAAGGCREDTPMAEIEVETVWRRVVEALGGV